jgi:hypothetical protein
MMFLLSHPMLFNITIVRDTTFEEVVQLHFNIPFRSRFSPEFLASWNEIKMRLLIWLDSVMVMNLVGP